MGKSCTLKLLEALMIIFWYLSYQNQWETSHPFIWDHFCYCGIFLRQSSDKKVDISCFRTLIQISSLPLFCKWRDSKWCNIAKSGLKWELVMSLNGCYQNSSHKEIKKGPRSFKLQFLLISALILPYFHYFFAFGNILKGHMSFKMVWN